MSIGVVYPIPEPDNCELYREDRIAVFRGIRTSHHRISSGVTLRYEMCSRRVYGDGWYDGNVGIRGGSVHLGQLLVELNIPFSEVVRAMAEAGDKDALSAAGRNFGISLQKRKDKELLYTLEKNVSL
jgi:hypothetical protein